MRQPSSRSNSTLKPGKSRVLDYLGVADVGQVLHPQGLDAQIRGSAAVMGFRPRGNWNGMSMTRPTVAPTPQGLYQAKPPTYLDVPAKLGSHAVTGATDPQNPSRAQKAWSVNRFRGAASSAYLSAVSEALGGHLFNRVPVVADMIVNALAKTSAIVINPYKPIASNWRKENQTMTDVMHSFDLFAPASIEEAAKLLDKHGKEAWIIAGGKDSFDWFKDRHKRPSAVIDITGLKQLHGVSDKGELHRCRGPIDI